MNRNSKRWILDNQKHHLIMLQNVEEATQEQIVNAKAVQQNECLVVTGDVITIDLAPGPTVRSGGHAAGDLIQKRDAWEIGGRFSYHKDAPEAMALFQNLIMGDLDKLKIQEQKKWDLLMKLQLRLRGMR